MAPVTRGVTFLGANWSRPTATTVSMPALIRAKDLSFDFLSLLQYCSFCIKQIHWKPYVTQRKNKNLQTWNYWSASYNDEVTSYLSLPLRSFSNFFIDPESLPSSPSWNKYWQKHIRPLPSLQYVTTKYNTSYTTRKHMLPPTIVVPSLYDAPNLFQAS